MDHLFLLGFNDVMQDVRFWLLHDDICALRAFEAGVLLPAQNAFHDIQSMGFSQC